MQYLKDTGFTQIAQVVLVAGGGPDLRTPLDATAPDSNLENTVLIAVVVTCLFVMVLVPERCIGELA